MAESNTLELLCQLTHAGNLQQICDLTYQITGNPVFISDMAHTILAYTKCVDISDETWQANIVNANLERNTLKQDREVGSVHVTSEDETRPVLVEDDFLPYPRIIKSLIQDHRAVGVFVLTSYCKPIGPQDLDLVELISSFVIPRLMQEHYHLTDDKHTAENFFIKLLDGAVFSRDKVNHRLDVLGYHQKAHTYVLALCSNSSKDSVKNGTLSQIRMNFSACLHCPVVVYNSLLVCVYGSDQPVTHWPEDVPGLLELLEHWGLIAGVSRRLEGVEQLRDRYLQAQAVLEKGRRLNRPTLCFRFDDLSSYLLFDRIPQTDLDMYCHEQIRALWTYDQEHGTELCPTLQVYLEQAKSLARTADILFVHRNTVRYRINRCMELLGSDLEDGNEIFAYILSLRIREYQVKHCHAGTGE